MIGRSGEIGSWISVLAVQHYDDDDDDDICVYIRKFRKNIYQKVKKSLLANNMLTMQVMSMKNWLFNQ